MGENRLPLVSCFVSVYNHEKFIAECIESIINQDYENIELIIINGGSIDKTHDVIMGFVEECRKRCVRFEYRNRENRWLSNTLNEMLEWCRGKYFTGCASDDVMLKDKISLLVNTLENLNENYAVAFGDAIFIDENGKEIYLVDPKTGLPNTKGNSFNSFLRYYTYNYKINFLTGDVLGCYETLLNGSDLLAMSSVIKLDKIREVGEGTPNNVIEDWKCGLTCQKI